MLIESCAGCFPEVVANPWGVFLNLKIAHKKTKGQRRPMPEPASRAPSSVITSFA